MPLNRCIRHDRYQAGTMQTDPGGTANLAVLGGNVPPSFGIAGAPRAMDMSPVTTGR